MLFPLFSKVFTDVLKIYELPKINIIPKYCQTLVLAIIIYKVILCPNCIWLLNYTPITFIENVP